MFKFKLEKLLNIRKKQEEDLGRAYSIKLKEIKQKEDELSNLVKEEFEVKINMRKEKIMIGELQQMERYIFKLKNLQENLKQEITILKEQAEVLKNNLLNARKKRKTLEKLKEKKYQKYLYEQNLKEQKTLDESGINKFIRKKT